MCPLPHHWIFLNGTHVRQLEPKTVSFLCMCVLFSTIFQNSFVFMLFSGISKKNDETPKKYQVIKAPTPRGLLRNVIWQCLVPWIIMNLKFCCKWWILMWVFWSRYWFVDCHPWKYSFFLLWIVKLWIFLSVLLKILRPTKLFQTSVS